MKFHELKSIFVYRIVKNLIQTHNSRFFGNKSHISRQKKNLLQSQDSNRGPSMLEKYRRSNH